MKRCHMRRPVWCVVIGVILCVCLVQAFVLVQYITHDSDLDSVEVKSSSLLRRLYLTGPTKSEGSLVTLFTTASDLPTTLKLHKVILNNWANLISLGVQPVLFTTFTNATLVSEAQILAWDILPVNRTNRFGLPFISDLYNAAYAFYDSQFYCYANADVLFDESFVFTLKFLAKHTHRGRMLVVGKSTDIPVDVVNPPPFHDLKFVRMLSQKEKRSPHNTDYVITARHGFPWDQLKGGVVGRIGVTAHLMLQAEKISMVTVDASETIRAVHLKGVRQEQEPRTMKDNLFNHFSLGGWDPQKRNIERTKFYTQGNNVSITLRERLL